MRDFREKKVLKYVGAMLPMNFPEGRVCCRECILYKVTMEGRKKCMFNNITVNEPNTAVGYDCPLIFIDDNVDDKGR